MSVASSILSSCAPAYRRPEIIPIWYKNAPDDWVVPQRYLDEGCVKKDLVVLENGEPNGLATIRLTCKDSTVLLDEKTKRLVWRRNWITGR